MHLKRYAEGWKTKIHRKLAKGSNDMVQGKKRYKSLGGNISDSFDEAAIITLLNMCKDVTRANLSGYKKDDSIDVVLDKIKNIGNGLITLACICEAYCHDIKENGNLNNDTVVNMYDFND